VSLARRTPLRRKSQSPLAIAHDNLWVAFSWMIREDGDWTCFTCGTKIDPRQKDERNISMAFYMHAGHFKPQGIYKSVKCDPCNVRPQCLRCNKFLHGNLGAYSVALEKRFGFGILQTLERRSKLYFDYTVPLLEKSARRSAKSRQENPKSSRRSCRRLERLIFARYSLSSEAGFSCD
jgi:Bacteriophage Lambda NinG protein